MFVNEKPARFDSLQWDGSTASADAIVARYPPLIEPYTIDEGDGCLEFMHEGFGGTIQVPLNGWVLWGPFYGTPSSYGYAYAVWADADYQNRFTPEA